MFQADRFLIQVDVSSVTPVHEPAQEPSGGIYTTVVCSHPLPLL